MRLNNQPLEPIVYGVQSTPYLGNLIGQEVALSAGVIVIIKPYDLSLNQGYEMQRQGERLPAELHTKPTRSRHYLF